MGVTTIRLLGDIQLLFAVQLLSTGYDSILSISHRCGFSDQAHLNRKFKRSFGWSPAQFQKKGPVLQDFKWLKNVVTSQTDNSMPV
ncbi:MAG TPA: hypothetical protein DDW81_16930 [Cryomorphaceae bacterium]|nr:hypothetical protein [Owenweeksia sp.]HBF21787.1 hypothetical protein [Cryomorphaceae bacterium]HCQ15940.1 hypothetical protein [Cryomorphaceae bacterium]